MYIALFSILIFQLSTSDDWNGARTHAHITLLIYGNQSITFQVASSCYKVFVIYNVPSVLTLITSCAEEPATKNWDKLREGKFNITIQQVASWRNWQFLQINSLFCSVVTITRSPSRQFIEVKRHLVNCV